MRGTKEAIGLLMVLLVAGGNAGCLPMAAGAGAGLGVAHAKGNLEILVESPAEELTAAAEAAVEGVGLHLISTTLWDSEAEVLGRTTHGKRVRIRVRALNEGLSKLSIRVGTFGNQELTQRVYEGIREELERLPLAAVR